MEVRKDIFGWFDSPEQTVAVHDPGMDGLCIVCGLKISHPMKTISLMKIGDNRSFFTEFIKNVLTKQMKRK